MKKAENYIPIIITREHIKGAIQQAQQDVLKEFSDLIDKHNLPIRICTHCNKPMIQGYCINDGDSYFCSKECLDEKFTQSEQEELEIGSDSSNSYWTNWLN